MFQSWWNRSTQPDPNEVSSYITQAANSRGIDPQTALSVWKSEGAGGYTGDNGTSFGPFQLHYGQGGRGYAQAGMGNDFTRSTGLHANDPGTWKQQVDFALDQAKTGGWGPWYGAKRAGITGMQGINGQATSPATAFPGAELPDPLSKAPDMNWNPEDPQGLLSMASYQPQQGGLLGGQAPGPAAQPQQAAAAQGFNWGGDNPLWMSLLGLGAGLAGGSNWGEGLGQGLGNAATLMQAQQKHQDSIAQQDWTRQLALANLGLRARSTAAAEANSDRAGRDANTKEQSVLTALDTAAGGYGDIYSTLTGDYGRLGQGAQKLFGGGKLVDTQSRMKVQLENIMGKNLSDEEAASYIPQGADSAKERIRKMVDFADLVKNRYNTYAATQSDPAAWIKSREALLKRLNVAGATPEATTSDPVPGTARGPLPQGQVEAGATGAPPGVRTYKNKKTGERGYIDPNTRQWVPIK